MVGIQIYARIKIRYIVCGKSSTAVCSTALVLRWGSTRDSSACLEEGQRKGRCCRSWGGATAAVADAEATMATMAPQDEDEEGEEYGASSEEVEFAMQQALALNAQLRRMELEMNAEQQLQMQKAQAQAQMRMQMQQSGRRPQGSSGLGTSVKQRGAKNGGWGGSTHSVDRSRAIERDNANLVKHLTEIASAPRSSASQGGRGALPPAGAPKPRASASINRQRQNNQIAQENARLAKRLAGAKPAVSNFREHAAKQDAHKRNASRARARPDWA